MSNASLIHAPIAAAPCIPQSSDVQQEPLETEVIVDYLIYASYRANRIRSPHIAFRRWGAIYSQIDALEARFQSEQSSHLSAAA